MNFELAEEFRMLRDLVADFVNDHLLPLEPAVLEREARGEGLHLTPDERATLDARSRELGLWGLDAPESMGGVDLPAVALVGVNEEIGRSVVPYVLPPDSPNLRMLDATVDDAQRLRYLEPYVRGEPGAGSDPAAMKTSAVRDGDGWRLNGRKIWISKADVADHFITMAVTDRDKGARGGISAFLVDRDAPGLRVARRIPMLGGNTTFELELDDCRLPAGALLGEEGKGFAPMQLRLSTRRLEMATWCIGIARRALDMLVEYAPQRQTFGS